MDHASAYSPPANSGQLACGIRHHQPTYREIAELFLKQRENQYRYRMRGYCWFVWSGSRWEKDETRRVIYRDAHNFARDAGRHHVTISCVEAIVRRARLALCEDDRWNGE